MTAVSQLAPGARTVPAAQSDMPAVVCWKLLLNEMAVIVNAELPTFSGETTWALDIAPMGSLGKLSGTGANDTRRITLLAESPI